MLVALNYYNDNDPISADWILDLIRRGLVPDGHIDRDSIRLVEDGDVERFTQCHFFAGIAGWPLALDLAGWPRSWPVWTGSCPCQPYSSAGKKKGDEDSRNLWPAFRRLIRERRPPAIFGEQVAGKAGLAWVSGVRADLEAMGYAVGVADLCAAGAGQEAQGWIVRGDRGGWERITLGAPHIRQRLYWVAHDPSRRFGQGDTVGRRGGRGVRSQGNGVGPADRGGPIDMAIAECPSRGTNPEGRKLIADRTDRGRAEASSQSRVRRLHDVVANGERLGIRGGGHGSAGGASSGVQGSDGERERLRLDAWAGGSVIHCRDERYRRIPEAQSGIFPMAPGLPGRVGLLKGYGNAIVPQVAAIFIRSFMEAVGLQPAI